MVTAKKTEKVTLNGLRWLGVLVLLVAGLFANQYYAAVAWGIRAAVGIVVFLAALGLAATTSQGIKARVFIRSAKIELRKVVWPTRQETVQMTVIVIIMVLIASLILWGLDGLFGNLVHWLTTKAAL